MTNPTTNEQYIPPFAGLALGYMTIMYFAGLGLFWMIKGAPPLLGAWIIWLPLSIAGGLCYAPLVRAHARRRSQNKQAVANAPANVSNTQAPTNLPAEEHQAA